MAKKKEDGVEMAEMVQETVVEAAEAELTPKARHEEIGEITVKHRDHLGETVERVFSREVHGEDFLKLADEFKATNASRIVNE